MSNPPRVLFVVQRYGDGVSGGAEALARDVVGHLRPHAEIEVATTTALDYRTWEHELTPGEDRVDGVPVWRFMPERPRARDFKRFERAAYARTRSLADERAFIDAQGPVVPELLEFVHAERERFDVIVFSTYIYYPTVYGVPLAPERALLVPNAHDEPALGLSTYRALFHAPRAIAFNTEEERALVLRQFGNHRVPSAIVGGGIEAATAADASRFRQKHDLPDPFFLYIGRIVESKGCDELFANWERWRAHANGRRASLVLIGTDEMPIPVRADVKHVGRVSEQEKADALAACSALVMPSRLESLSLVTLEAWSAGTPALVPEASPVLAGMARRAGAGLLYGSAEEFGELCELILERPSIRARLGERGRAFVGSTYTWERVVETYLDLFAEIRARNG